MHTQTVSRKEQKRGGESGDRARASFSILDGTVLFSTHIEKNRLLCLLKKIKRLVFESVRRCEQKEE